MDFGSLQTVTAWRLTRAATVCEGVVVHERDGFRLIVIEDQQIVEWTRFTSVFELREHVRAAFKKRVKAGWVARPTQMDAAHLPDEITTVIRRRRPDAHSAHGLLQIAEREAS